MVSVDRPRNGRSTARRLGTGADTGITTGEKRQKMLDVFTQSEFLSTYPLIEGCRDWPEGSVYRFERGGHEVLRIIRGASAELAAAVARDPVDLALVIDGPLVV